MRRIRLVLVLVAVVAAAVVLPVVALPTATPRPVAPRIHALSADDLALGSGIAARQQGGRAASRAVDTEGFSLVGASVPADGAPLPALEVRVRRGGGWTPWLELGPMDSGPDAGTADANGGRSTTEPMWTGAADGVQVRVASGAALPDGFRVDLVDPGQSPADSSLGRPRLVGGDGATAEALMRQPTIITRAQWGADESRRCASGPEYGSTVRVGFVHHTVSSNDYAQADVPGMLRSIYAFHVNTNGWCDIGYNFLVDRWGRVFEGRFGGVDRPVIGAHTGGFNTDTFGVSMIGNFDAVAPPAATVQAVEAVLAWKLGGNYRDPNGSTTLLSRCEGSSCKFPPGTTHSFPNVSAHRDASFTACPGQAAYALMPSIRAHVASLVGSIDTTIYRKWQSMGGEGGFLGAPVIGEHPHAGGDRTVFRSGNIYASASTPASVVYGGILAAYRGFGEGGSGLGLPTTDEAPAGGNGRYNFFRNGAIFWRADLGAFGVQGGIYGRWSVLNREWGLGYPTSNERYGNGGAWSEFERGRIYWSPTSGAWDVQGDILGAYLRRSGPASPIGFPVTGKGAGGNGGAYNLFQRGGIFSRGDTGTHVVEGGIYERWSVLSREWFLGYPTSDERYGNGGAWSEFERGRIYWSPATGAHEVYGGILAEYLGRGGPGSCLGFPTTGERDAPGGRESIFQGGRLFWDAATGVVSGGCG